MGGVAVLGIAKGNGLNLRDLDHLTEDRFFRDNGTGSCEVFAGRRKVVRPATP